MNFGGGFNSGTQPSFSNPQTSGPFGMSNVFGASQSSGGFGTGTGTSLFNSTPSTPASGGGIFGGSTGSQLFGSFGQQSRGFGTGAMTPFGGSGQSSFNVTPSSSTISPDGSQGTRGRAFERVSENADRLGDTGVGRDQSKCYMMNMSAMHDFRGCQPEMLRSGDYKKGNKKCSGQVQNPSASGSNMFSNPGGFGTTPSGTGSTGFGGGFRSSNFGMSSGVFGQSSQPSSGGFGAFNKSSGAFGQQQSPGGGFGSSFGNTGGSIFGGGMSSGFGNTGGSIFGAQQSGPSIFGNQPSSMFGTSSGVASSGPGLFGQSTGSSIFGSGTTPGFQSTGFSGSSLFGPQSSTGFAFGGNTGGSLFGQVSGTSIFGQTPTSNLFGGSNFGQSSAFPAFSWGQNQQPAGNVFGPTQPTQSGAPMWGQASGPQQQPPTSGGYFAAAVMPFNNDPSTKPNWTPEHGLVIPDTSIFLKSGIKSETDASGVNTYDYLRRDREKQFVNRFVPVPVKFALDDPPSESKVQKKPDVGWDSFAMARPVKASLEDEVKESIESFAKLSASSALPSSSSDAAPTLFNFLTPTRDPQFDESVSAIMKMEYERKNRAKSVDGLTPDEIKALLPTLDKADYYILPTMSGLEHLVTVNGKDALKTVSGVEIGRREYGKICFSGPVNLEQLDINAAISIKRGRVQPGALDNALTAVPATVTLYKVFSKNKGKDGFLKAGSELLEEVERFKKQTRGMRGDFVSYDRSGTWTFKVQDLGA